MSLADFVTERKKEATMTVLNRESGRPLYRLLTDLFEDAITIQESTTEAETLADAVLVEKRDADGGFALSPFETIRDELLLVNADIYVTGMRRLEEIDTPDVLTHLDEIPFTVRGRPADPKEKLLLIEMSRHIEAMAWQAGEGRLHAGFQYLSRLNDERGTQRVYDRLGNGTDVDTHVYGVPDARPALSGLKTHGVDDPEIRQSWFVVYQSNQQPHEAAALVAVKDEPHTWSGFWTYDSAQVAAIEEYLGQRHA